MSHDEKALEHRIRDRAHALWEADGQPHGTPDEYWYRARRELLDEGETNPGSLDDQLANTFPASDPLSATQPHGAEVAWPEEAKKKKAPAKKAAAPAKKTETEAAKPEAAPKPRARRKKDT
jgi:hypothetical protein